MMQGTLTSTEPWLQLIILALAQASVVYHLPYAQQSTAKQTGLHFASALATTVCRGVFRFANSL